MNIKIKLYSEPSGQLIRIQPCTQLQADGLFIISLFAANFNRFAYDGIFFMVILAATMSLILIPKKKDLYFVL